MQCVIQALLIDIVLARIMLKRKYIPETFSRETKEYGSSRP